MITQNKNPPSALRHARRQQLEFKIKELNLQLIRVVAERMELVKLKAELNPSAVPAVMPAAPVVVKKPVTIRKPPRGGGRLFTMEVLASIPSLVAAGHNTEEIARKVGCKINSLRVTCSRHKISLRKQAA
jgi:hypothetical protein